MAVTPVDPNVAQRVADWLASKQGEQATIEVGTYRPDAEPTETCPLRVVTTLGTTEKPLGADKPDASILVDLPAMMTSRLSFDPKRIVNVEFSGDGHSLRVQFEDTMLIGVLVIPGL